MKPAVLALCLAGVAMSPVAFGAAANEVSPEVQGKLVNGGHFDCLPLAGFGLRGVRLWESEDAAKGKLGEPLRITEGSSEDDGGQYTEVTYHYADMEISIVRGEIDRIYTASPRVSMDSGVRVGFSRAEVIGILGREPRDWQSGESGFSIVTCPENGVWVQEDYVDMKFAAAGVFESIEFLANRP